MANGKHAAILGHSFVRRLCESIELEDAQHTLFREYVPVSLNVDLCYRSIEVKGTSEALIENLKAKIDSVTTEPVDIVVFISGSNDLVDPTADPKQLANRLVSLRDYARNRGVKLTVFCGAIHRNKCRGMVVSEFDDRVQRFNAHLHSLCTPAHLGRQFFGFKGFWREPDSSTKLAVGKFSGDGIHPGPDIDSEGFQKFRRQLRRCLLAAVARHESL